MSGKPNGGAATGTAAGEGEFGFIDHEADLNWFNQERKPAGGDSRQYDQRVHRSLLGLRSLGEGGGEGVSPAWQPNEIPLGDGRPLVLDPP